jgi:DNA-binding NarL/FixJ family response regulator
MIIQAGGPNLGREITVNHELDEALINELGFIRRLLALSLIEGKKRKEQVRLLASAGLGRHEIAELLATSPGAISVEISNLRKHGVLHGRKT